MLALPFLFACNSNGGNGDAGDMDARVLREGSAANCIQPGTPSNEQGVGGWCEIRQDCPGTLCTGQFGAPADAWFCSKLCATNDECGKNALCILDPEGRGQACVPMACIKDSGAPDATTDATMESGLDAGVAD